MPVERMRRVGAKREDEIVGEKRNSQEIREVRKGGRRGGRNEEGSADNGF